MTLHNFTATSCARWRAAIARQDAGGAPATIFIAGDSNTQPEAGLPKWHETMLASQRAATPARYDDRLVWFTRPDTFDTRRQFGSGWAINGFGQNGPANSGILSSSGGAGVFTYGPVTCDSFRLHYSRFGGGSFTWRVDNGTVSAPVSVVGSGDYGFIDIPAGSVGSHSLSLVDSTGGTQFVALGWADSTSAKRRVSHVGQFGSGTDTWAPTLDAIYDVVATDLTIVLLGSNDYGFREITTAQTLANLSAWIDRAHAEGSDFLLSVPAPSTSDGATTNHVPPWPPQDLRDGLHALSASKDVPLIDLAATWGTYENARNVLGFMGDNVHFNIAGHENVGQQYRAALRAASGNASAALRFGGQDRAATLYVGGVARSFTVQ